MCLCEGVSSVSGQWRVEECGGGGGVEGEEEEEEGKRVRRLVFVKTSHLVQTEMRLRPGTLNTQYVGLFFAFYAICKHFLCEFSGNISTISEILVVPASCYTLVVLFTFCVCVCVCVCLHLLVSEVGTTSKHRKALKDVCVCVCGKPVPQSLYSLPTVKPNP